MLKNAIMDVTVENALGGECRWWRTYIVRNAYSGEDTWLRMKMGSGECV